MRYSTLRSQFIDNLLKERLKFMILLCVFVFQAASSIISIFYMEEILAMAGFEFISPITPSTEAVFTDFFNDQLLFYFFLMALGTMGIFASDIANGSIEFYLTRPITRTDFAIAKIISRVVVLIMPFAVTALVMWSYLGLILETIPFERLFFALIIVCLLYLYFGVVTSALSTRFSSLTSAFTAIGLFFVQFTISTLKPIELLSPVTAANIWGPILKGSENFTSTKYITSIVFLLIWVTVPFLLAVYSFKKRDL